jgi:hypothetical protein
VHMQKLMIFMPVVTLCLTAVAQESQPSPSEVPVAGAVPRNDSGEIDTSAPSNYASQSTPPPSSITPIRKSTTRTLSIFVLAGNGAMNSLHSRSSAPLVVEIRDHQNAPVEGAEVILQLPTTGPSGFFPGQQLTWTGTTDANGQVIAASFTPNQDKGRFDIQVTARYAGSLSHTVISQTNAFRAVALDSPRHSTHSRIWKVAAVAGACGSAGGIVWALHGSGKPSVSLQPGSISIGTPR